METTLETPESTPSGYPPAEKHRLKWSVWSHDTNRNDPLCHWNAAAREAFWLDSFPATRYWPAGSTFCSPLPPATLCPLWGGDGSASRAGPGGNDLRPAPVWISAEDLCGRPERGISRADCRDRGLLLVLFHPLHDALPGLRRRPLLSQLSVVHRRHVRHRGHD